MSSLTNNPNKTNKFKKIDRGNEIKPQESVNMNDILLNQKKQKGDSDNKIPNNKVDSITYSSMIRVNNHIKNKLQSLAIIGIAESQKNAINIALDYYISSLTGEEQRKLKNQLEVLEERDVQIKGRKHNTQK